MLCSRYTVFWTFELFFFFRFFVIVACQKKKRFGLAETWRCLLSIFEMHYSEVMIFVCSSIRRLYLFYPVIMCWCLYRILRRVLEFRRPHPKTPVPLRCSPVLCIKGTTRSTVARGAHSPAVERRTEAQDDARRCSRDPADVRKAAFLLVRGARWKVC